MSFTTLIFGNGLGRAINNDFFALDKGIFKVWNQRGDLEISHDVKESILSCLPRVNGKRPKIPVSEEQLQLLHEIRNACRKIRDVEPASVEWLSETFREFPESIEEFVAKVSYHFHTYPNLNQEKRHSVFVDGLSKFIKKYRSHIATLNYDNLLYQPLIDKEILKGWDGHLVDGFYRNKGFSNSHLVRRTHNKDMGWYLHLHGSPLFCDTDYGIIKKITQYELPESFEISPLARRHVVLAHSQDKPQIIGESPILKTYWRYFSKALAQSTYIYIFGYGGGDNHLNKEIALWAEQRLELNKSITIKIVERKTSTDIDIRKNYWSKKFSTEEFQVPVTNIKMQRLSNILDFNWEREL